MTIEKKEILNLANQIYLNLSEEDLQKLTCDIGDIVEETKILDEIDVSNVKKDVSVLNYSNVFRRDIVQEYKEIDLLLQNAKEVHNNMFKIPKIIS